jgi:DNA-binding NtrC family response regulator
MSTPPLFLVIDLNVESRFLLAKTLRRKFPGADVQEFDDAEPARHILLDRRVAAIVAHRTFEHSGVELARIFRDACPDIPLILVSGIDREREALSAGATSFLFYDEWLRLGSVVERLLLERQRAEEISEV